MIVETHSEALIAELAEQVATEKLDPSLVSILCFEPAEGGSTVRVATFREDRSGRLDNWPIGFFSATP